MATTSAGRPGWQRNPVFKFFASLKLAVVLLAVLIIASIAGTIWESSFDAKVARAYVYGAPWFNLWLLLLVANLAVAAFSRWPWKKHHVAFLVTHLGIITLALRFVDRPHLGSRRDDHALQGRSAEQSTPHR